MRIFLVGMMGSGKSTLGRKLATALNLSFADTDKMIEDKWGCTVSQIFNEQGERIFRRYEKDLITNGLPDKLVIATGGGLPCHDALMDTLTKTGIVVYLKMSPKALAKRLSQSESYTRPLIKGMDEHALIDYLEKENSKREVYYNKAHIIFDGINAARRIDALKEKISQLR